MRIRLAAMVWAMAAAAGPLAAVATATPDAGSTRFALLEQGGILVAVRLNGTGPFQFLLDTGATHSVISEDLVRALGAPLVARTTLTTTTGADLQAVARIDRFELGPISIAGLLPSVARTAGIDPAGQIQGVLGQDVLAPRRYTIDFDRRCIEWGGEGAGPERGASLFALEPVDGRFVVALPQRGSTLRLVPDSGSGGLVLFVRADRQLVPLTQEERTVELTTLTGRARVRQATVHELRIGGTTRRNVTAVLMMRPGSGRSEPDGLLPLHGFRRVTFDGPRRVLILHQ